MKKDIWTRIIAIDLLMLCFAINVSIVGQMLGPIGNHYSLSLTQAGWLVSSQSVGGLALALMCILFIDRLNKIKILLVSGVLLSAMLIFIGLSVPVATLFVVFIVLGFSASGVNALSNSAMSDTIPQKADKHLTLLHMVYSFGAVITPILSQFLYLRYSLAGVFLAFGGFAFASVLYAIFSFRKQALVKLKPEKVSMKLRVAEAKSVMRKKGMKIVIIIVIMVSAWQMGAVYYMSSYFSDISGSANYGAAALSIYFLSMMISRLFYSRIAGKYSKGKVLMVTNLVGVGFWIAMFFVPGVYAKIALAGLNGFVCSNNFPILFSSAFDIAPNNKASATGFVMLGYYIALLAFLPLVGFLGDAYGLQYSLAVVTIPMLLTALFARMLHKKNFNPSLS